MIISKLKNNLKIIGFIIVSVFLSSCVGKKEIVYFQNAKNFETIVDTDTFRAKLKIGDIVSIYVSVMTATTPEGTIIDPATPFNLVRKGGSGSANFVDYLIDVDGNIDFPVLGKVKLVGLTIEEAKNLFKEKFAQGELLTDPVIIMRVLNFRVTISGEVRSPGVYPITGERVSIIEALGMAGDLTIKGRRDNVMVIRDFNGTKTITHIDLTTKEVFNSPVYYLTQNDIVYVEPNNSAVSSASGDTRIGTIISITSFILTTALIFVTRRN